MTMPNFLIIGAAKAGTTAFYRYFNQHPQIYLSPTKETKFFALEGEKVDYHGPGDREANRFVITSIQAYCEQFRGVSTERAIGEASPLYLYSPKAPGRIRHYVPNAKLLAILRDPAKRAYSSFLHAVRDGRETITDFAQALREEEMRVQKNWALIWRYKSAGFYYVQLKRYFDIFDSGQIKIYLYEDFNANPITVLQDSFSFLAVDDTFIPDISTRHNESGIPRSKVLHRLLTMQIPVEHALRPLIPGRLRSIIAGLKRRNLIKPELSPDLRRQLIEVYREDILRLQDLIQRDLSKWLE